MKETILLKAEEVQRQAWKIIADTHIIEIWNEIGATINLVGSLKMGLQIKHKDIDFHIYTDPFYLKNSFCAIEKLAENRNIHSISYTNLIDTEDQCIEWHATYQEKEQEEWVIDMIHILPSSPYVGYFEKVADRIIEKLTDETKLAILKIKTELPDDHSVMGIQIYQAVLEGGVRTTDEMHQWQKHNPPSGIIQWMP